MNKVYSLIGFVSLLLFFGCNNKYPSNILQPDELENFLYDYHIAQAMGNDVKPGDSYKRQLYIDYVYRKHHVTHAEFDSTLVWYTRHAEELSKIYSNLNKRIEKEKSSIVVNDHADQALTASGDTVNIWMNKRLYLLSSSEYTNKISFSLKTDSSYHKRDIFKWTGNFIFLPTYLHSDQQAYMAFRIKYDNDSIAAETREIRTLGENSIFIVADSVQTIKDINGYIYYQGNNKMLVSNIRLMRYHQNDSTKFINSSKEIKTIHPTVRKDTLQHHDSLRTAPATPQRRLNPTQVRDSKPIIKKQYIRKR